MSAFSGSLFMSVLLARKKATASLNMASVSLRSKLAEH